MSSKALERTITAPFYLSLRNAAPMSPDGLTVYRPTENAWRFLGAAIRTGEAPVMKDDAAVAVVWQAGEGGIRRWEQEVTGVGERVVRVFRDVSEVGSFGDGALEEARLYKLVEEKGELRWRGQSIDSHGKLGNIFYPYAGTPLSAFLDLAESQMHRDQTTRRAQEGAQE